MKRLYIGGLGHTGSEKDLKVRFGKFGDVSSSENISLHQHKHHRCVGILNKSTWKGGTLLIQLAKESFLHRLAEERQQLVEKTKTPKTIPQDPQLLDSLKVAGVENFHMKAAVPGTKKFPNWVVSKFGRVLPVLNLKYKGKNKISLSYDPSKHCHIKRLEAADDVTSVSKLTWELEGGNDEISKKRRGEFPKQKPCPKRSKIDLSLFLGNLAQRNANNAAAIENKTKVAIQQNGLSATKTGKQKSVCVLDNEADSEDEIRMLVAQEHLRNPKQTSTEDDDDNDNLEVVGDDFIVKSNVFWGGVEQESLLTSSKDDEEYDSTDTDEILTQRKTQKTQGQSTPASPDSSTKSSKNVSSSTSDDDDVSVDSDYEAMMGNCYRLDLFLADLEQLAKKAEVISDDESVEETKEEDILASLRGDKEKKKKKKKNQVNTVSLPAFIGTKDLFGGPEPSLKRVAQSINCESPKQDLKLKEKSILENTSQPQTSNRPSQQVMSTLKVKSTSKNWRIKRPSQKMILLVKNQKAVVMKMSSLLKHLQRNNRSSSISISKTSSATQSARTISETEVKTVSANNSIKPKQTVSHQTFLHSTVIDTRKQQQDNQKRLAALEQCQKETKQQRKLIQGALSKVDTVKANKSKHIVFGSDEEEDETTSRPEQPPTNLKKSLFEDNSGSDEDQQTSTLKEKPGGSKLFDCEDEDDSAEDERFQIKPQFEGKAGQKLMKLQASFGTDSRFQVDSRFLESDDESEDQDAAAPEKDADEQLLEEKKKSLDILQSILNSSIQPQNTRKGKTFKDVSSLHYDPTQEEHAAFETKTEEPKKERYYKRKEAEKLPEVSKDIYFDISVDLKEVFGTSEENQEEKETVSWDKEAEETEDMEVSFTSNVEAKEDTSGGFKFSFFGKDTAVETTTKTDEYKIETLKGAKFSWQVDPRFQDSSSDEEGRDEIEEDQSASSKITDEPTTSKKTFFFFYQDDERLKGEI
uniref:RRM domain-containing protein n=1 Tax=Sinocyclocheilus anshuiensis TaxID=1608454 RepID=A0A671T8F0_9TELE